MDEQERSTGSESIDMAHDAPYQRLYTLLTVVGVVALIVGAIGMLKMLRAIAVESPRDVDGGLVLEGALLCGGAIFGYLIMWMFATILGTQREILAHLRRRS